MSKAKPSKSETRRKLYYQSRGFGTYYFANAIFNIVLNTFDYLRGIEDILGDTKTEWFTEPFKKYTNLHEFSRCIITEILYEDIHRPEKNLNFIGDFIKKYEVPILVVEYNDDRDALVESLAESEEFERALEELTDEVFHVLFADVGFLQRFNVLVASYIGHAEFSPDDNSNVTKGGTLRRVAVPEWAQKAIYHRDKGECRSCKRTLATTINQTEFERYDHIVPLACHGPNDVTNLQLLCEECNRKKSASNEAVSTYHLRALQR